MMNEHFMNSRKAIVFDLDGTLVDTLPDLMGSLNKALAECGLPGVEATVLLDSLHGGLGATAGAALRALTADMTLHPELSKRYEQLYTDQLCESSLPFSGVVEFLEMLKRAGVPMGVCTNKLEQQAKQLLTHLDLIQYFDAVVGADTYPYSKPHPLPLLKLLEQLGAEPSASAFVGDSVVDAHTALNAQVPLLYYTQGYGGSCKTEWKAIEFDCYSSLLSHPAQT